MSIEAHAPLCGAASVTALDDGDRLSLITHRALAPGQRLELRLALSPSLVVPIKSHGSRRRDDGRFDVEARALTMTRDARARIAAALGGAAP